MLKRHLHRIKNAHIEKESIEKKTHKYMAFKKVQALAFINSYQVSLYQVSSFFSRRRRCRWFFVNSRRV